MKNYKTIIAVAVAGLVLSSVTTKASFTIDASLLNQTLTQTLPTVGPNDGTISSWVLSGYDTAPGAGLTFVFQVYNTGPDTIDSVSLNGFGGGLVLTTATLSSLAGLTGSTTGTGSFTFNTVSGGGSASFFGSLASDSYSYLLIINTTATTWSGSIGKVTDTFQAAGPTLAPVPEPSTVVAGALMLLPLGVGAFRALRKERIA